MKLSTLFISAALAQKKLLEPPQQLEKLKGHIEYVWKTWYAATPGCENRAEKKERYLNLIDRIEAQYHDCGYFNPELEFGGPPTLSRRRREDTETSDDDKDPRLSKDDRAKATKQLGKIMKNFAERYLTQCTRGLTVEKVTEKSIKWIDNMQRMKCIGGAGRARDE